MNEQLDGVKSNLGKYIKAVNQKQVFFVVLACSAILIYTLIQASSFLSPERNENRYTEESLKVNYATIDEEVVDEISKTLQDEDINVDSNFVPGRNNPFAE